MRAMHEGYDPDRDILLFAAHVYVTGAKRSPSERAVDDGFETGPENLPEVSYAALGHIHRPQVVRGAKCTARYAGSPLAMDFGEADESKSVVIVDADPGRPVRALPRRLSSGRRLTQFTGTLDELRTFSAEYDGTFFKPVITGEEPDALLSHKIAEIVPDAILVNPAPAREAAADAVMDGDPGEPELPDAFRAYLASEGLSGAAAESTVTAFTHLLNELDDETLPRPRPRNAPRCAGKHLDGGVVKPSRLIVSGMRSYPGTCTIDFTGKRHFAILGRTGAGKSTLLEGFTFGLYGASSWSSKAEEAYELISTGSPSMHVTFEFSVNGRPWRVRRTLYANRKKPQAVLESMAEGGADLRVDNMRAVTEAVTQLIGLDWKGFVSTVLLPQGKFDNLLKANKGDRADILRHVFGINELERVRKHAGVRLERLSAGILDARTARADLLRDPMPSPHRRRWMWSVRVASRKAGASGWPPCARHKGGPPHTSTARPLWTRRHGCCVSAASRMRLSLWPRWPRRRRSSMAKPQSRKRPDAI
ncbi:metallophosphoesterase family protein [Streptomyces sp. C8S0]|uniref:metallophosphoesterase family protein n=1 Tax=Streptomyces sp. C8S0 TaxID=2585716 RepID=UPI00125DF49E|nr:AAA family ATPase [Streptomyces sp. C8S0]